MLREQIRAASIFTSHLSEKEIPSHAFRGKYLLALALSGCPLPEDNYPTTTNNSNETTSTSSASESEAHPTDTSSNNSTDSNNTSEESTSCNGSESTDETGEEKFECMESGCNKYHGNCGIIVNNFCGIVDEKQQCACNPPYTGDHCELCKPDTQDGPDCPEDGTGPTVTVDNPPPVEVMEGQSFSLFGTCSNDTAEMAYTINGGAPITLKPEELHCYPFSSWQANGLENPGPVDGIEDEFCFTGKDKKGNISGKACVEVIEKRG